MRDGRTVARVMVRDRGGAAVTSAATLTRHAGRILARAARWARRQAVATWEGIPGPVPVRVVIVGACLLFPGPLDEYALVAFARLRRAAKARGGWRALAREIPPAVRGRMLAARRRVRRGGREEPIFEDGCGTARRPCWRHAATGLHACPVAHGEDSDVMLAEPA